MKLVQRCQVERLDLIFLLILWVIFELHSSEFRSLWHMNSCTACFHSLLRDLLRLVCQVGSIAFEVGSRSPRSDSTACIIFMHPWFMAWSNAHDEYIPALFGIIYTGRSPWFGIILHTVLKFKYMHGAVHSTYRTQKKKHAWIDLPELLAHLGSNLWWLIHLFQPMLRAATIDWAHVRRQ